MRKEDYKNEQGYCPKCHSLNLDYGTIETVDGMCYYPLQVRRLRTRGRGVV